MNTTINSTLSSSSTSLPLKQIHDILIIVLLLCVMFAMGCAVTLKELLNHLKRPLSLIVGLAVQLVILPFAAFCLIYSLNLDSLHATGLLILACCPGGVTSNIFTYLMDGDVSLSIVLTSLATLVALIFMPLNVWFYGTILETESSNTLVIPYLQMSFTLFIVTIPVAFGILLNWKLPKFTPYITKAGAIAGLAIILICQTLEVFIFPQIFIAIPFGIYVSLVVLPFLGVTFGYISGRMCGLKPFICRTLGIEIGIKNVGTALTIISLSFPFEELDKPLLYPFLYAFSALALLIIFSLFYRLSQFFCSESKHPFETNDKKCVSEPLMAENELKIRITSNQQI